MYDATRWWAYEKYAWRIVARKYFSGDRQPIQHAWDEALDGIHGPAPRQSYDDNDGRAKGYFWAVRCSKLKTTECCFWRSETAQSNELAEPSVAGDRQRLCDGGEKLERVRKSWRMRDILLRIQARNENRNWNVNQISERDRVKPILFA